MYLFGCFAHTMVAIFFSGELKTNTPGAIRTHNQQLRRLVLCPLSYGGKSVNYNVNSKKLNNRSLVLYIVSLLRGGSQATSHKY